MAKTENFIAIFSYTYVCMYNKNISIDNSDKKRVGISNKYVLLCIV